MRRRKAATAQRLRQASRLEGWSTVPYILITLSFGLVAAAVFTLRASGTHTAPGSITADCSTDVTAQLQAWIDSVPNSSTLTFPNGTCYRIDKTIILSKRSGLTFAGNGATFRAVTSGTENSQTQRTRAQFRIVQSSQIVMRNMTVKGAHPNGGTSESAYVVSLEAQHGFDIIASTDVLIENNTVTDVYGDFVYVGNTTPSRRVTIRGNTMARNGRQGISVTGGEDILIENNDISAVRRSTFDVEPNLASAVNRRITIARNRVGTGRLTFLANKGAGGVVEDITIDSNVVTGKAMNIIAEAPTSLRRLRYRVTNNITDTGYGSPSGTVFYFKGIDGIIVRDNVQPAQAGRNMSLVRLSNSTGADVRGNTTKYAIAALTADASSSNYYACGNRYVTTGAFDKPVACPVATPTPTAVPGPGGTTPRPITGTRAASPAPTPSSVPAGGVTQAGPVASPKAGTGQAGTLDGVKQAAEADITLNSTQPKLAERANALVTSPFRLIILLLGIAGLAYGVNEVRRRLIAPRPSSALGTAAIATKEAELPEVVRAMPSSKVTPGEIVLPDNWKDQV